MHVRGSLSEVLVHYKAHDGHTFLRHRDCPNTRAASGVHLLPCAEVASIAHASVNVTPGPASFLPTFSIHLHFLIYFQLMLINDVHLYKKT